jgi:hypothetical protein
VSAREARYMSGAAKILQTSKDVNKIPPGFKDEPGREAIARYN